MGIKVSSSDSNKTEAWLKRMNSAAIFAALNKHGQAGVAALSQATPADSGLTAQSWSYEIIRRSGYVSIRWYNSHRDGDRPVAILLQYGHATRNGGYVQGRDYIMPAIRPIFDQIDAEVRKVVST